MGRVVSTKKECNDITPKKLTVAERREKLESEIAELDILEKVEDEINNLIERYDRYYKDELSTSEIVGKEEEQATNSDGELLFTIEGDYRRYTNKELDEKGIPNDMRVPYFRDKWETKEVEFEELDKWTKQRATAYKRIADFLKNLDITEVK